MAYRADIEIAVRGAQDLKRLQNEISATSKLIIGLNSYIENIGSGGVVRNISTLQDTVQKAANAFNQAALNTDEAAIAARKYIDATRDLNAGLRERQALLKSISAEERKNRLSAIGREVGGRPSVGYAGPIGPGPASPVGSLVGQRSPVEERIKRTLAMRRDELALEQALLRLEEKSASVANAELQARGQIAAITARSVNAAKFTAGQSTTPLALPAYTERGLQVLNNNVKLNQSNLRIEQALNGERARGVRFLEKQSAEEARQVELGILGQRSNRLRGTSAVAGGPFPVEGPIPLSQFGRTTPAQSAGRRGLGSRVGGAVSGSIIGGAFPLLFGQGGGAAAGGAIGGLVGGLAGPGGSFAGSLLGTLLGDIASRGQAVKQLGEDLGFSAAQAATLADAFKTANTDVEKFTAVIQNIRGVGLELEEQATAVQLVTALTEKYGGSFEKVGNAVTSALESGKVSQAVLNQLTSQGITVQDALAAKYDVSRDKILEMAKSGKISVQSLLDTLVELGNASTTAAEKTQTPFEKALSTTGQLFQRFWKDVQAIFAGVSSNGVEAGTSLLNIFNKLLEEALLPLGRFLARIAALFVDVLSTGVRAAEELINGFRGAVSVIGDALMGIVNMIPGLRTIVNLARQLFKEATKSKSSDWNDMPWPEGIPKPGSPGMIGRITAPSQAMGSGGGSSKASKEAERLAKELERSLAAGRQLATQFSRQVLLLNEADEIERQRLQIQFDYEDRAKQIAELKNAEQRVNLTDLNNEIKRLETLKLQTTELKKQLDAFSKRAGLPFGEMLPGGAGAFRTDISLTPSTGMQAEVDRVKQELDELLDPINQVATAAEGIGLAFSDSFKGIVSGTMTAQEALAGFFQNIADQFLDMAAQIIAKWIQLTILNSILKLFPTGPATGAAASGGFTLPGGAGFAKGFGMESLITLPGRAAGGPVSAGSPYIVGERGPELFVPGRSGTIVPNDKMGGDNVSVVVNVDAKGTSVQGNDQTGNQLGRVISAAVQQELIKQKRPGGLLA